MTTLVHKITTPNWQPKLGEPGSVVTDFEDIIQSIKIIVTTPKGSDPLRPTFGSDALHYLDMPVNQGTAPLIADVAMAILAWEPRVTLVRVTPRPDLANPGHVDLDIEWSFHGITKSQISSYRLPS